LAYLAQLEEDNLFKIHLVQDEEQNVKFANENAEIKFKEVESAIDKVQKSID